MKKLIIILAIFASLICTYSFGWDTLMQDMWDGWQKIGGGVGLGVQATKKAINGTPCIFATYGSGVAVSCDWSH